MRRGGGFYAGVRGAQAVFCGRCNSRFLSGRFGRIAMDALMNLRHIAFAAALLGVWVGASAQEKKVPAFNAELSLVRYDQPRGLSDGLAPTRQLAQRRDGQDAVEWPDCTLNGQPVFRGKAVEQV